MQADTAGWAALVPWTGLQNPPATITALAETTPQSGTVTIPLAPLTGGGNQGQLTFKNGLLTGYRNPT